jgi:hypothetical protein
MDKEGGVVCRAKQCDTPGVHRSPNVELKAESKSQRSEASDQRSEAGGKRRDIGKSPVRGDMFIENKKQTWTKVPLGTTYFQL